LAEYLGGFDLNVQYLHSEIDALERVDIIRDLRLGNFEVLIGVNLLREGLDLPEVTLVAIMDADKEGFLRSETSLVQTAGRAARNVSGKVLLYADRITNSMARAMEETERRRLKQIEFNEKHGITPTTIIKSVDDVMASTGIADARKKEEAPQPEKPDYLESLPIEAKIDELERMMNRAAANMEFEQAAFFRDEIRELENALPPSRKKERGKSRPKNPGKKITRFY
jgi:excinuclease ABC subunit B